MEPDMEKQTHYCVWCTSKFAADTNAIALTATDFFFVIHLKWTYASSILCTVCYAQLYGKSGM